MKKARGQRTIRWSSLSLQRMDKHLRRLTMARVTASSELTTITIHPSAWWKQQPLSKATEQAVEVHELLSYLQVRQIQAYQLCRAIVMAYRLSRDQLIELRQPRSNPIEQACHQTITMSKLMASQAGLTLREVPRNWALTGLHRPSPGNKTQLLMVWWWTNRIIRNHSTTWCLPSVKTVKTAVTMGQVATLKAIRTTLHLVVSRDATAEPMLKMVTRADWAVPSRLSRLHRHLLRLRLWALTLFESFHSLSCDTYSLLFAEFGSIDNNYLNL